MKFVNVKGKKGIIVQWQMIEHMMTEILKEIDEKGNVRIAITKA
jgi:hypothetical protein